ncbi:MAG: phosphoribosylanthranilate isomerase [Dehalococcoidales bacterium]|jgi:phosphoribosylanthranilate isomerase
MTKVKICGIKTEEQALAAAEAGADFVGLVFTRSPRQITPAQANKIVAALRKRTHAAVEIVGVFVNTPVQVVNRIAEFCTLDRVQLSGDENFDYFRNLAPACIKVMRINRLHQAEQICLDMASWSKALIGRKYIFLLDAYNAEKFGGTGQLVDWDVVKPVAEKFKVIVAGGLTPENVTEAIKKIRPWGVDVSSGVETEGEKDVKKIEAFIKAVRDSDAVHA